MTPCLDEESILSFCRGTMAAERRPPAEAHVAECEECRVLVSAVMRSSRIDPSELVPASKPSTEVEKKADMAMDPTAPLQRPARPVVTAPPAEAPSPTTNPEKPAARGVRTVLALTAAVGLLVVLGILFDTMASRRRREAPRAARTTDSSANATPSTATASAPAASASLSERK
jgi:hypothetical protein